MTGSIQENLIALYEDYKILWGDFERQQKELEFLRKRENKLQRIEQMYANMPVDLTELAKLIKGE